MEVNGWDYFFDFVIKTGFDLCLTRDRTDPLSIISILFSRRLTNAIIKQSPRHHPPNGSGRSTASLTTRVRISPTSNMTHDQQETRHVAEHRHSLFGNQPNANIYPRSQVPPSYKKIPTKRAVSRNNLFDDSIKQAFLKSYSCQT